MNLPKQVGAITRGGAARAVAPEERLITPSCPSGWRGAPCRAAAAAAAHRRDLERGACQIACRSAQASAISACAAGVESGPLAAACSAAAYEAGEQCYNGC